MKRAITAISIARSTEGGRFLGIFFDAVAAPDFRSTSEQRRKGARSLPFRDRPRGEFSPAGRRALRNGCAEERVPVWAEPALENEKERERERRQKRIYRLFARFACRAVGV